MVKGPCLFVVACLDAWMTVSNQHNTHTHRHHMVQWCVSNAVWSFILIHKYSFCLLTFWKPSLLSIPQGSALLLKPVFPFTYCPCGVCVNLGINSCLPYFSITYLSLLSWYFKSCLSFCCFLGNATWPWWMSSMFWDCRWGLLDNPCIKCSVMLHWNWTCWRGGPGEHSVY